FSCQVMFGNRYIDFGCTIIAVISIFSFFIFGDSFYRVGARGDTGKRNDAANGLFANRGTTYSCNDYHYGELPYFYREIRYIPNRRSSRCLFFIWNVYGAVCYHLFGYEYKTMLLIQSII